jgi:hypothetical protein
VKGENKVDSFISVLGGFANLLNVPQLSAVINIAQPLSTGIQRLFGVGADHLHLGFYSSYAAGELRDGYIAVIRATEGQLDRQSLWVSGDQLCIGENKFPNSNPPLTGFDYMLIRVELLEKRDDWEQLTSIAQPLAAAFKSLSQPIPTAESQALQQVRQALVAAYEAPELTVADRVQVIEKIKTRFKEAKDKLAFSGAFDGEATSLEDIMANVRPPENRASIRLPSRSSLFAEL